MNKPMTSAKFQQIGNRFRKCLSKESGFKFYKPAYSSYIFILILLILFFIFRFDDVLDLKPQSLHQWRQCDCLSITLNYYKGDTDFLNPEMHSQEADRGTSGHTLRELPYLYFVVAKLWQLFGFHEWIFRFIVLLTMFVGLFALFKMTEDILQDSFFGMLVPLVLFTSPFLVYYSFNFIDDTPALGIAFIALYCFWLFFKKGKNLYLVLSLLLFLLASLTRVIAVMGFFAIFSVYWLELFRIFKFKKHGKVFQKPILQLVQFLIVLGVIFSWYSFANKYNFIHKSGFLVIGVLPLWELPNEAILYTIGQIKNFWFKQYFSPYISVFLFSCFLFIIIRAKRMSRLFLSLTIVSTLEMLVYLVLYFKVLANHDYHLINLLFVVPLILVSFFLSIKEHWSKVYHSIITKIVLILILSVGVMHAQKNMKTRYFGWMNHHHQTYFKALEDITPYLRSLGIERDDKVVSIPDASFNITLYLMDQKGWTSGGSNSNGIKMDRCIDLGAEFLIINNAEWKNRDDVKSYLDHPYGVYQNIEIFDLRPYAE
jgi:hypothetical protein